MRSALTMPYRKVPVLTELDSTPANGDLVHIIDVDDSSEDDTGTSKKITWANLVKNYVDGLISTVTSSFSSHLSDTTPHQFTSIDDSNGNEVIKTPATTDAVNEITVTNSATGNPVKVEATGSDTNIDLNLLPKGSGALTVTGITDYENNVTDDDDIPNKKYVDDNAGSSDGWTSSADTWVYASASTFTIAGVDRTATFTKGTRLKFTQTTAKYAVVVGSTFSTNTTVTIAVNTDYTIANATITSPNYSYQMNPQGYPGWFSVIAPTFYGIDDGAGGQPTMAVNKLKVDGATASIHIRLSSAYKASTNSYFYLDGTSYPTASNSPARTCIGHGHSQTIGDLNLGLTIGTISTNYYWWWDSSVTDNTQFSNISALIVYEI